jgi:hypothetical protein
MIRTGLCSVTLRALAIDAVVQVTADAGLDRIEWGGDVHVPPGDLAAAAAARDATVGAGLRVASYGSYYRAGRDDSADFAAVLASARALAAPRIRIWAGETGSAEATSRERATVALAARDAVDQAATHGIDVAFEFHGGTLTDEAGSALQLLEAVEQGRPGTRRPLTYWQPPQDVPDEDALAGLRRLLGRVTAVHVFSWWPASTRLPLADRAPMWRTAFQWLAPARAPVDALLEFVPEDDPTLVAEEARTLKELTQEASRVQA